MILLANPLVSGVVAYATPRVFCAVFPKHRDGFPLEVYRVAIRTFFQSVVDSDPKLEYGIKVIIPRNSWIVALALSYYLQSKPTFVIESAKDVAMCFSAYLIGLAVCDLFRTFSYKCAHWGLHVPLIGPSLRDLMVKLGEEEERAATVKKTYKNRSKAYVNHYRNLVRQQNTANAVNNTPSLSIPPINLNYTLIPQEHHNDVVLRQYECAFTHLPIRYPVLIVNAGTNHYYELKEIVEWIAEHGTNPLSTDQPFDEQHLVVDLHAQRAIESQMRQLGLLL